MSRKVSAADGKEAESSAAGTPKTTTLFNVTSNLSKVKQGTLAEVFSPSGKSESEEQEVISIDDTSSDSSVASPGPPQLEDTRQTKEIFPPVQEGDESRSSSSSYRPSSNASSRSSSPALAADTGTVAEDVSWMVRSEGTVSVVKPKAARMPQLSMESYPRGLTLQPGDPRMELFERPTPQPQPTTRTYPHLQQAATALSENRVCLRFDPKTGMFTSTPLQTKNSGDNN